jgi:hypothetical protein
MSSPTFLQSYLPLADEWGVWDNYSPPAIQIASNSTHSHAELIELLTKSRLMETTPTKPDEMTAIVLEASRVATEKMLDLYKRMGIRVTKYMTLAPEPKKRTRKVKSVQGQ